MKILLILLALMISGCSTLRPESTILIYPIDSEGIKKVEIKQTRTGKTSYKSEDVTFEYDSKGTSIIQDVSKEILPIIMLKAMSDN